MTRLECRCGAALATAAEVSHRLCRQCDVKYSRARRIEKPWCKSYEAARSRCNCKTDISYPRYGGRGIKFLLTLTQARFLWIADNAESMSKATIDRIDPDGNYEFSNCRFLEHLENCGRRRNAK